MGQQKVPERLILLDKSRLSLRESCVFPFFSGAKGDNSVRPDEALLCDILISELAVFALAAVLSKRTGASAQTANWNQP